MDNTSNIATAVETVREGALKLIENIRSVIYIDTTKLEYIIAAKIAGGHVMLADSHGVGKTSLARALATSIRWREADVSSEGIEVEPFSRIQCTVDLLPQDILGYTGGDCDLDGDVDISDLGIMAGHFGTTDYTVWHGGDLTGDSLVNISDLGILAGNFGVGVLGAPGGGQSIALIPEPATLAILGVGGLAMLRRGRVR